MNIKLHFNSSTRSGLMQLNYWLYYEHFTLLHTSCRESWEILENITYLLKTTAPGVSKIAIFFENTVSGISLGGY